MIGEIESGPSAADRDWKAPSSPDNTVEKPKNVEQKLRDNADWLIERVVKGASGDYSSKKTTELYAFARGRLNEQASAEFSDKPHAQDFPDLTPKEAAKMQKMLPEKLDPEQIVQWIIESYNPGYRGKVEPSTLEAHKTYLGAKAKLAKREITPNTLKAQYDIERPLFNQLRDEEWERLTVATRSALALKEENERGVYIPDYKKREIQEKAVERAHEVIEAEKAGRRIPEDEQVEEEQLEELELENQIAKLKTVVDAFDAFYDQQRDDSDMEYMERQSRFGDEEDQEESMARVNADMQGRLKSWLTKHEIGEQIASQISEYAARGRDSDTPLKDWLKGRI